jgi:imidazolonepropionase-like amidohydrolase
MRCSLLIILCLTLLYPLTQATPTPKPQPESVVLLKPARVFDGENAELHSGWVVLVREQKIEFAGPGNELQIPSGVKVIELPNLTLMPGMIEAHSHVL